jgi:hypothetical protein
MWGQLLDGSQVVVTDVEAVHVAPDGLRSVLKVCNGLVQVGFVPCPTPFCASFSASSSSSDSASVCLLCASVDCVPLVRTCMVWVGEWVLTGRERQDEGGLAAAHMLDITEQLLLLRGVM